MGLKTSVGPPSTTSRTTVGFLLACALLLFLPAAHAQDQPNIVLGFMDNFGWGEPGFNGGGIVRGAATPRLDGLAAEGLRLTNFNVEVQCTPSRSALMTGRYAIRSGNGTVPLGEGVYGLAQWEVTMAEMLSRAGYATGMYGKWHLGRTEGRFPTDQGFDEWYGIPNTTDESVHSSLPGFAGSGLPQPFVLDARKGNAPEKARPYDLDYRPLIDRDLTDRARDFMRRQATAGTPFFVYLPYTATHFPTLPHPEFEGKSGRGRWGDMLMQIDSYVGELLDAIDDLGIAWNTILRTYTMPRVYNLISDPREHDNVIFPHTWVLKAGLPQLEEHVASLRAEAPIKPGTLDPYDPPRQAGDGREGVASSWYTP